jgi:hypothetical protein
MNKEQETVEGKDRDRKKNYPVIFTLVFVNLM